MRSSAVIFPLLALVTSVTSAPAGRLLIPKAAPAVGAAIIEPIHVDERAAPAAGGLVVGPIHVDHRSASAIDIEVELENPTDVRG